MKASQLLREAIELLKQREPDRNFGLCYAVDTVKRRRRGHNIIATVGRVKSVITRDLDGWQWLQTWLVAKGHIGSMEFLRTPEGAAKIRDTRIAWAEDLIRYFESKGD